MNLYCKSILLFLSFFLIAPCYAIKSNHGIDGFVQGEINAAKNARLHSNMGNIYFDEGKYISALKEYEIAYNLAYESQAGGVYLYNIARCYMELGNFNVAKKAIEGAIRKDCINITYYETLCECIFKLNIQEKELRKYIHDSSNPYNKIMVGLIYKNSGRAMQARAVFDDFIVQYPDMLIAEDVKLLLRQM